MCEPEIKKLLKIIKTFKECCRQTKTSVLGEEFRVWPTFQVKVPKGWSRTGRFFFRLLEALELKCREKSSLRLSQVFFYLKPLR